MKAALVGCLHGNPWALAAVLEDLAGRRIVEVYVLGDLVGPGPDAAACVGLARKHHLSAVMGHWDAACVTGDATLLDEAERALLPRVRASLGPEHLGFLRGLPKGMALHLEGMRIALVHGTPHRLTTGLGARDEQAHEEALRAAGADVLGCAHSHEAFVAQRAAGMVVNPGAAGLEPGLAPYALLTLEGGVVEAALAEARYDPGPLERARQAAQG